MQRKMNIVISFLLGVAMIVVQTIGMDTEINSSHLRSKILNGDPSQTEEHKYTVSLQLDGSHICGSGLFQKGFLLTTALCAWYIGIGIQKEMKRATAVLGDVNLRKGQRIYILKVAYQCVCSFGSSCPIRDYDIGVIMLADNIDYTRAQVLNLCDFKFNLLKNKSYATVCGWGTTEYDDYKVDNIGNGGYSENLHCMSITLRNETVCRNAIPGGDYRNKLMCGEAKFSGQLTTLRDLGNPLTKFIVENNEPKHFIIGITLHRPLNTIDIYLRFYRSSILTGDVQRILQKLQSKEVEDENCLENS